MKRVALLVPTSSHQGSNRHWQTKNIIPMCRRLRRRVYKRSWLCVLCVLCATACTHKLRSGRTPQCTRLHHEGRQDTIAAML